jgi:hypothetical protein
MEELREVATEANFLTPPACAWPIPWRTWRMGAQEGGRLSS